MSEQRRSTQVNTPILSTHFYPGSNAEGELCGNSGGWVDGSCIVTLVRMVAHDSLQSSLFTHFYTIELQSEHLCAVIGALSLEK